MADSNSRIVYLSKETPHGSVLVTPQVFEKPIPTLDDLWSWLPPLRLKRIVEQAYKAAQHSCIPPTGQPFADEDGTAYADKDGFVDTLLEEFENLIRLRMGTKAEVVTHRLLRFHSEPQDALLAALGAAWRRLPKSGGRAGQ